MLLAQTTTDGFMMRPKQVCIAATYNHSSFGFYWEGTLFRDNKSLGRVYNHSFMAMAAYGVGKNLNVLVSLPYIRTNAYSTIIGQRGLQDVAVGLKLRPVTFSFNDNEKGVNKLSVFTIINYSMPASNYYPDYQPLSIGLGSRNLQLGATAHYLHKKNWFATANASYTMRSNITIDRNFYYTDRAYYTNIVDMPNVAQGSLSVGYRYNQEFRMSAYIMHQNTLGGTDIRRNDMPFPSHNMDMTRIGTELLYRPNELDNRWGISANGGYTIGGRNVGQSVFVGLGFTYQTK
jgi:hypothetical protein